MYLNLIFFLLFSMIGFSFLTMSPIIFSLLVVCFSLFGGVILFHLSVSWIMYTLILLFLGGMMVIFIYVSSLVTSEKNFMKIGPSGFLGGLPVFSFCLWGVEEVLLEKKNTESFNLMSVFNYYGCENLIFLTLILLITLFMVVKMVQIYKGPLKWKPL